MDGGSTNSDFLSTYGQQGERTEKSVDFKIVLENKTQQYDGNIFANYPKELLYCAASVFILFAILGTFGNFISILALYKCRRLWNATIVFIVNLCFAGLLFSSTTMPQTAVIFIERSWNYSDGLCRFFGFVKYMNAPVSVLTIISISVNRYVLIVHPRLYRKLYTNKNIIMMICMIWGIPFLFLFPSVIEIWGKFGYDPKVSGDCSLVEHDGKSSKTFLYSITYIIPFFVFAFCYIRIYIVVKKAKKKIQQASDGTGVEMNYKKDDKEFQLLKILLVMFILYICCYFPTNWVKLCRKEKDLPGVNVLGYIFFFLSNVMNPIIYIFMSKEYRNAYKELLCKNARHRDNSVL